MSRVALGLASALLVCLLGLPSATAQGGGSVSNVAPAIDTFASQAAQVGALTRLNGVSSDRNGEADIAILRLNRTAPSPLTASHAVTSADLAAPTAPTNATAGWRVWDPVDNDGLLSWTFDWVPTSSGSHSWNLTTFDEARNATQVLNVSVAAAPSGGGGGGGGGGSGTGDPTPPPSAQPPPADPPPAPDASLPPPIDSFAGVPRDLSFSLTVTGDGGQARLEWAEVPGAMGYQVWRHTSPWILRAEITDLAQSHYEEPLPGREAFYKVSFFTNRTLAGGWAPTGDEAPQIPGWDEGNAVVLAAPEQTAVGSGPTRPVTGWYVALGVGAAAVIAALAIVAARRLRTR